MATFSAYTDVPGILNDGTLNVELASLFTGNGTLSGTGCLAGATSINLNAGSNFATTSTFTAWFLDGANSESKPGCSYSANVLSVPSPGVSFAHGGGVSVSSAGTQGSLASIIARASSWVDDICRQGPDGGAERTLWRMSRIEVIAGPNSFRASFDPLGTLLVRPYHFPITAVSSVQIQMGAQNTLAVDTTFLVLPDNARTLQIPLAQITGSAPSTVTWLGFRFPRDVPFYCTLAYTGGPIPVLTVDSVPMEIREATYLLVQDLLGRRQNTLGAAMVRRGDVSYEMYLRGETSAKSGLRKRAEEILTPFRTSW